MTKQPNILILMSDQHRYDCTGISGIYPVQTPNIDRIAKDGIWFTNAFTPLPVCGPSRQSFICGRRPESFGAYWNDGIGLPIPSLTKNDYSWAKDMQAAHYATGYIGKWGGSSTADPTAFGYDRYINSDKEYTAFRAAKYPELSYANGVLGETDPVPLDDAPTHWLAKRSCEMLEDLSRSGGPWHARINFTEPHPPCRPSEPFSSLYDPKQVPVWGSFGDTFENKPYIQRQQLLNWGLEDFTWEDWAPTVARYYGIVSQMDDAVGMILQTLAELGEDENTIVIYTSDHGDMCGGHRMMDKHYILYDDVVKVPLAIRYPGVIAPGQICDSFVYNTLDLPPTMLEWLNLPVPEEFHGRSLLPLLEEQPPEDWRTSVVCTYNGQQFGLYVQRMIRTSTWKYIWNPTDLDELYDLVNDPNELINRIADPQCGETLSSLRRSLHGELKKTKDGILRGSWLDGQLLEGRKL
ncbi:sulfatase-like hydrolase/transferase [Paenibacillus herberti]|uniref:Sulfatase n=1 Tax=Paenibacillus herberti TaxID=1619309 RepID=A0A229P2J8_9BACL|nr:sulfatase-like hydrolase/transferase [Paenibacillus herberti]OXM16320.1 sulfatase [Paenibacillus herberti]